MDHDRDMLVVGLLEVGHDGGAAQFCQLFKRPPEGMFARVLRFSKVWEIYADNSVPVAEVLDLWRCAKQFCCEVLHPLLAQQDRVDYKWSRWGVAVAPQLLPPPPLLPPIPAWLVVDAGCAHVRA